MPCFLFRLLSPVFRILYSVSRRPSPPSIHFLFLRTPLTLAEVFVIIGEAIHCVPEQADN
jgi:hypothetical protein